MKNFVMPNGKHFSKSFLRTIQSQFNSIINYANSKGYLNQNPLADIKNMGIKDKRVEFWSTSEYERFAYCAMKYPNYYYAFEVLYWCGLREGEMLALTLQDIDLEQAVIYVNKTYQRFHRQDIISTPKTPSSVRKVSMPAFLCDELREYIDMLYSPAPDQRIFAITKSKLTHRFHKLSEEAGLRRITVHGLRHSHVSLLISKKYDIFEVSKRIGHKSIKTTQDIYGHLTVSEGGKNMSAKNCDTHNRFRDKTIAFRVSSEEDKQINTVVELSGMTKQDYITSKLLDRTIYVKGNCKVHRAVYDKLNEVLAELQRIENGGTVDDELMANVKLIAGIIDNLYIKSAI